MLIPFLPTYLAFGADGCVSLCGRYQHHGCQGLQHIPSKGGGANYLLLLYYTPLCVMDGAVFLSHSLQGVIAEGSDADIVVWEPEATRTISAQTHHHVSSPVVYSLCYVCVCV